MEYVLCPLAALMNIPRKNVCTFPPRNVPAGGLVQEIGECDAYKRLSGTLFRPHGSAWPDSKQSRWYVHCNRILDTGCYGQRRIYTRTCGSGGSRCYPAGLDYSYQWRGKILGRIRCRGYGTKDSGTEARLVHTEHGRSQAIWEASRSG